MEKHNKTSLYVNPFTLEKRRNMKNIARNIWNVAKNCPATDRKKDVLYCIAQRTLMDV